MNTMLSFNVDHWSWISSNEQQMVSHESRDVDLDDLIESIATQEALHETETLELTRSS